MEIQGSLSFQIYIESASGDYVMGFGFFDNGLLRVYSNGDSVGYYWRHHPSIEGSPFTSYL